MEQALGPGLVTAGELDRERTARRIFENERARESLNAIIHPWVRRVRMLMVNELLGGPEPPELIIHEIPLLFETGLEVGLDAVVVVEVPLELRATRVEASGRLDHAAVKVRDAVQMPLSEKVKRADYVVTNLGNREDLAAKVFRLWRELITRARDNEPQDSGVNVP
jgi:dephospho-CoA kinase